MISQPIRVDRSADERSPAKDDSEFARLGTWNRKLPACRMRGGRFITIHTCVTVRLPPACGGIEGGRFHDVEKNPSQALPACGEGIASS